MKKLILFIVCSAMLLAGCSNASENISQRLLAKNQYVVDEFSDAKMTIVDNTIGATGATVEFKYDGENEGQYGSWYTLQAYNDGNWYDLDYDYDGDYDVAWNDMAFPVSNGEPRQEKVDWEWLYGKLPSGQYRIIKDFLDFEGPGDYTKHYLSGEFDIE